LLSFSIFLPILTNFFFSKKARPGSNRQQNGHYKSSRKFDFSKRQHAEGREILKNINKIFKSLENRRRIPHYLNFE